jgi:hypothetical protein
MIPASYLYKDALTRRWGRDFERGTDRAPERIGPEWPAPSRLRAARDLFDLAFGSRGRR